MSKKLYAAFVPLLALTAFALVPPTSQAASHWYTCKKEAAKTHKFKDPDCKEATTTGEFELTRLPFTSVKTEVSTFGTLTLTTPLLTVKCNVLDEGVIWNENLANPGKDETTVFENHKCVLPGCTGTLTVTAGKLPWKTELTAGAPIKDRITGIEIDVTCSNPVVSEKFAGALEPTFVNGSPSFLEFEGAASGKLGEAAITGKDFVSNTETGENIDAFNP